MKLATVSAGWRNQPIDWTGSLLDYLHANQYSREEARSLIMVLRGCGCAVLGGGAVPYSYVALPGYAPPVASARHG